MKYYAGLDVSMEETAVCVIDGDGDWEHLEIAELEMRELGEQEIADYVAKDDPLDCAGSYKLEAAGIGLFGRVTCDDWTSIEGLPLLALSTHLRLQR